VCCRRADRQLKLVAIATDDNTEEEMEKDGKAMLKSFLSDRVSNLTPSSGPPQRAQANVYEAEPTAPVKVVEFRCTLQQFLQERTRT